MNRFDRSLEAYHRLNRQQDQLHSIFSEQLRGCSTIEEMRELATEQMKRMLAFSPLYEALGKATAKEYNRPWWRFW